MKILASVAVTISELLAFLRHPQLLQPEGLRAPGAAGRWAVLTVLQIGLLGGVVVQIMLAWQKAFGLSAPNAFDGMGPLALWGGAVVLAPMLEELFFRGWQTGRPAALWIFAAVVTGLALFVGFGKGNAVVGGLILLAMVLAAGAGWWRLRARRNAPAWFVRAFPAIFYGTVLIFAAMHLANYPNISLLMVPLVLPQAWSGVMFGYIRQRIGLVAAMLTHIASNAVMLSLALVG